MQAFPLTNDTIKAWAGRHQLPLLENEQLGQLALKHPSNPRVVLRFIPHAERNLFTFAIPLPVQATDERRDALMVALSLANSQTFSGAWVHNHGKNETYFRITLPTAGTAYTDQAIEQLVRMCFGSVDALGPKLFAVAHQGADPNTMLPK